MDVPEIASRMRRDSCCVVEGVVPLGRVEDVLEEVINLPGNELGYWHADGSCNGSNWTHLEGPCLDVMIHLSSVWRLTPSSAYSVWFPLTGPGSSAAGSPGRGLE
jgi:hypothetical protein